jgi:hypothetical protein
MSLPRHNWQCGSTGPQNNNLVAECGFTFYFDDREFRTPNCPVCGQVMERIEAPNSVSRLLRKGQLAAKAKK